MRMPRPTKEARRAPRIRHDSVLELYDERGRLAAGVLKLVDVSSVGASFTTTLALVPGQAIRGRVRLLGAGVLEITGRVVRSKEKTNSTLYAVAFDSVRAIRR